MRLHSCTNASVTANLASNWTFRTHLPLDFWHQLITLLPGVSLVHLTSLWSQAKMSCHLFHKCLWSSPNSSSSEGGITFWKAFLLQDNGDKWSTGSEACGGWWSRNWRRASLTTKLRCNNVWWSGTCLKISRQLKAKLGFVWGQEQNGKSFPI